MRLLRVATWLSIAASLALLAFLAYGIVTIARQDCPAGPRVILPGVEKLPRR